MKRFSKSSVCSSHLPLSPDSWTSTRYTHLRSFSQIPFVIWACTSPIANSLQYIDPIYYLSRCGSSCQVSLSWHAQSIVSWLIGEMWIWPWGSHHNSVHRVKSITKCNKSHSNNTVTLHLPHQWDKASNSKGVQILGRFLKIPIWVQALYPHP